MLLSEFNEHNNKLDMPRFDIGQGMGYKETTKKWSEISDDEIIYIPEYGYSTTTPAYVDRGDAQSKGDFKAIVKDYFSNGSLEKAKATVKKFADKSVGEIIDYIAEDLFHAVDWQYPMTLVDEGWLDDFIVQDSDDDTVSVSVNLKMDMKINPSFMDELKRIVDQHIERLVDTESFPEIKQIYGCTLTEI